MIERFLEDLLIIINSGVMLLGMGIAFRKRKQKEYSLLLVLNCILLSLLLILNIGIFYTGITFPLYILRFANTLSMGVLVANLFFVGIKWT